MFVTLPFEALLVLCLVCSSSKQTVIQDVAGCQVSLWLPWQMSYYSNKVYADVYRPKEPPHVGLLAFPQLVILHDDKYCVLNIE